MRKRVITVLLSGMIAMACTIGMYCRKSGAGRKFIQRIKLQYRMQKRLDDSVITGSVNKWI